MTSLYDNSTLSALHWERTHKIRTAKDWHHIREKKKDLSSPPK